MERRIGQKHLQLRKAHPPPDLAAPGASHSGTWETSTLSMPISTGRNFALTGPTSISCKSPRLQPAQAPRRGRRKVAPDEARARRSGRGRNLGLATKNIEGRSASRQGRGSAFCLLISEGKLRAFPLRPVLHLQTRHPLKLTHIICDQRESQATRMRGDEHIVGTDKSALGL